MAETDSLRRRLLNALKSKDVDEVRSALASGCYPGGASHELRPAPQAPWTPLLWCVHLDFPEGAKALAEAGADLDEASAEGDAPLLQAIQLGRVRMVAQLAESGASVLSTDPKRRTALHLAAHSSQLGTLRALEHLIEPAMLALFDGFDRTPLMHAAKFNLDDAIELLGSLGADPRQASATGETALTIAAIYGRVEAVRALLALGMGPSDVDREDAMGSTALTIAANNGHEEIASMLLRAGADPLRVPRMGLSAVGETLLRREKLGGRAPRSAVEDWADAAELQRTLELGVRGAPAGRSASL